jgi:hypothetical protein
MLLKEFPNDAFPFSRSTEVLRFNIGVVARENGSRGDAEEPGTTGD